MKLIKSLILILLTITALSCSEKAGKEAKSDWESMDLKGKVKSIKMLVYQFSACQEGMEEEPLVDTANMFFDEEGRLLKLNAYDSDGSSSTLSFDKDKKEREVYYFKMPNISKSREQIKYNENGLVVEKFSYESDSLLKERYTCRYSECGEKVEEAWYNASDSLTKKITHLYNDKGFLIEERALGAEEDVLWVNTYTYDNKGNVIETANYNSVDSLERRTTYKYDDKGNLFEKSFYNKFDSLILKETLLYDKEGSLVEDNFFYTEYSLYSQNSFEYKYDEMGNWTECVERGDSLLRFITKREIEYFD